MNLGKCEQRWVKTTDGKQMLVWIMLPSNFDANKKYPTLLFCEGGPQSPVSQFWSYRWNIQIAKPPRSPWFRKRMERRDFWRLDRPVHERLSFSY
ncbi:Uncharacterised protein [Segatella copri]|nr:Uncharacterised protein [Segatella copri]